MAVLGVGFGGRGKVGTFEQLAADFVSYFTLAFGGGTGLSTVARDGDGADFDHAAFAPLVDVFVVEVFDFFWGSGGLLGSLLATHGLDDHHFFTQGTEFFQGHAAAGDLFDKGVSVAFEAVSNDAVDIVIDPLGFDHGSEALELGEHELAVDEAV